MQAINDVENWIGKRPIAFGEALFDVFPDGTQVLGGAPLNIAWHLKGFGLDPILITRVGKDKNGRRIIQRMERWGLDLSGLQVDPNHRTGTVKISASGLLDGTHEFVIPPNQAFDFINVRAAKAVASKLDGTILYHGSLAVRSVASRRALDALLCNREISVFMDVNLDVDPNNIWWGAKNPSQMLHRARWLKLSDVELGMLTTSQGLQGKNLAQKALELQDEYSIELMVVTCGAKGAFAMLRNGEMYKVKPSTETDVVDTVGAGDAFNAVVLLGLIKGWELQQILDRAQEFASTICSVRGATLDNHKDYIRATAYFTD